MLMEKRKNTALTLIKSKKTYEIVAGDPARDSLRLLASSMGDIAWRKDPMRDLSFRASLLAFGDFGAIKQPRVVKGVNSPEIKNHDVLFPKILFAYI